jgi:hypothetical protein
VHGEGVDNVDIEIGLRTQIRFLQASVAALGLMLLILIVTGFNLGERHEDIIRARGLIIEDDQGRERILIGSPIPAAKNRVRTDIARVKQVWGKRFPAKYMDWYTTYQNGMNGILILDANGFDRVAVGDPVPDPNTGKRIGPSSGFVINDEEGFERSGYGLLKVENRYRVVLGMDNTKGQEGATMFLIDDGPVGLEMQDGTRQRKFGLYPKEEKNKANPR